MFTQSFDDWDLHANVHSTIKCNGNKLPTTQMSMDLYIYEPIVLYWDYPILLNYKKKQNNTHNRGEFCTHK